MSRLPETFLRPRLADLPPLPGTLTTLVIKTLPSPISVTVHSKPRTGREDQTRTESHLTDHDTGFLVHVHEEAPDLPFLRGPLSGILCRTYDCRGHAGRGSTDVPYQDRGGSYPVVRQTVRTGNCIRTSECRVIHLGYSSTLISLISVRGVQLQSQLLSDVSDSRTF